MKKFLSNSSWAGINVIVAIIALIIAIPSAFIASRTILPQLSIHNPFPISISVTDTTNSTNCGETIESKSPDVGGPPSTQLNLTINAGCVGILIAYSGNVDIGQEQWDQHGGLVALREGNHTIIFTDGEIVFSPSSQANTIFCKLSNDSRSADILYKMNGYYLNGLHAE